MKRDLEQSRCGHIRHWHHTSASFISADTVMSSGTIDEVSEGAAAEVGDVSEDSFWLNRVTE